MVFNDNTDPTVVITAPVAGTTVSGTVSVTVSATDNISVTKAEFYVDGVWQRTDSSSPYSWSWDTTRFANRSYTIVAKAYYYNEPSPS